MVIPDLLQNLLAGSGLLALASVLVAWIGKMGKRDEAKSTDQQSFIDDLGERLGRQEARVSTLESKVDALRSDLQAEQTHSHRMRLRLHTFLDYLRRVTVWRAEQPPEHLAGVPDLPDVDDLAALLDYEPTYRARDVPPTSDTT